jgi:general secretion pathway protein G
MKYEIVRNQRAFTLVELIMVTAIVAVLCAMAIPAFNDFVKKAKIGRCSEEIRVIEKAITAYIIEKNTLPTTLLEAGFSNTDPWQRPYVYNIIGSGPAPLENFLTLPLNTDYDLYSTGADGASNASVTAVTSDDIVRSNDGGFVGSRAGL